MAAKKKSTNKSQKRSKKMPEADLYFTGVGVIIGAAFLLVAFMVGFALF